MSCGTKVLVCLDEACRHVDEMEDCGSLTDISALIDMVATTLVLIGLFFDRLTRPAFAEALALATQPGAVCADVGRKGGKLRRKSQAAAKAAENAGSVGVELPKVGVENYAVWVTNPDPDMVNPDEWKDYFERHFGEVTWLFIFFLILDHDGD
jgi:hypothetical protein